MMASITYQVKFKDSKAMDALVEKLDDEATQNFTIIATNHSKMTEFRRQLKTKAIQAAKEKGIYLTEAINEKLGAAITVREPDEPTWHPVSNMRSQAIVTYDRAMPDDKDIEFKKIKLRFEVTVIFALQ